jgi:uncharacterized DUF497 family protein
MSLEILKDCFGFQWDDGNHDKNWISHQVTKLECEQIFFNNPLLIGDDKKHSKTEIRYYALGKTDDERKLFIVFTIRENLIRIISARDMSKKEREIY